MCGRYTVTVSKSDVSARFLCSVMGEGAPLPRFNIAPTQSAPVVIISGGIRRLEWLRWGVPSPVWAPDDVRGWINARAETAHQKPAFRGLVNGHRCLVPADGFYEWIRRSAHASHPHYFHRPDRSLVAFAGLWTACRPEDAPSMVSDPGAFLILTTRASSTVSAVHDRMPVILRREDESAWLDPTLRYTDLPTGWMDPLSGGSLSVYEVGRLVNRVTCDAKECILPTQPEPDLFGPL